MICAIGRQVVRADVEEQHPRRKVKNADSKVRQQFVRHEAADAAVVHHNRQIVFRDELLNRKHFHQRRPGKDDLPLPRGLVQLTIADDFVLLVHAFFLLC